MGSVAGMGCVAKKAVLVGSVAGVGGGQLPRGVPGVCGCRGRGKGGTGEVDAGYAEGVLKGAVASSEISKGSMWQIGKGSGVEGLGGSGRARGTAAKECGMVRGGPVPLETDVALPRKVVRASEVVDLGKPMPAVLGVVAVCNGGTTAGRKQGLHGCNSCLFAFARWVELHVPVTTEVSGKITRGSWAARASMVSACLAGGQYSVTSRARLASSSETVAVRARPGTRSWRPTREIPCGRRMATPPCGPPRGPGVAAL